MGGDLVGVDLYIMGGDLVDVDLMCVDLIDVDNWKWNRSERGRMKGLRNSFQVWYSSKSIIDKIILQCAFQA